MSVSAADDDEAAADSGGLTYRYKPSLMGAPWQLQLRPEGLAWSIGRYDGVVRYDRVRRVRMSFRPASMQSHRFITELWSDDAPKIQIASVSWRSMVEQERQDQAYNAFVTDLHRRLAAAGTRATFQTGMPLILFAIGIVVYAGALLGFAALTVRALQISEWAGAAVVGGFFLLFAWQVGNYFRRNWPGTYRADALPAHVMPRT